MSVRKMAVPSVWGLVFLVCFCAVGAVIVSPAMGDIARHFDLPINQAGQMMSVYLFGYALGQLIYGPLADALGRKKSLLVGILLSLAGALFCLLGVITESFVLFLTARFVMALGSSASLVVAFIIVNDTAQGKEARRKMSILFSSLAVAVPTTTTISGWVQSHFGWAPVFFVFIVYAVALLVMVDYFPETGMRRKNALSVDLVANRYLLLLANKKLLRYSLIYGCLASLLYVFHTLSPIIMIEILGLTPKTFGWLNYLPNLGLLLGSMLSAWIASRRTTLEVVEFALCILGIGALFLLLFNFIHFHHAYVVLLPMCVALGGMGMMVGNIAVLASANIKDKSYAMALYNFIALGCSVLSTLVVGFIPHQYSFRTLTVVVLLSLIITAITLAWDQKKTN